MLPVNILIMSFASIHSMNNLRLAMLQHYFSNFKTNGNQLSLKSISISQSTSEIVGTHCGLNTKVELFAQSISYTGLEESISRDCQASVPIYGKEIIVKKKVREIQTHFSLHVRGGAECNVAGSLRSLFSFLFRALCLSYMGPSVFYLFIYLKVGKIK